MFFSSYILCSLIIIYFLFSYLSPHSPLISFPNNQNGIPHIWGSHGRQDSIVSWAVTPCSLAGDYQLSGGTHHLHLEYAVLIRNVDNNLQDHMASQPRDHDRHWTLYESCFEWLHRVINIYQNTPKKTALMWTEGSNNPVIEHAPSVLNWFLLFE